VKGARAACGAVLASLLAASCYPTTIRSGRPALPSSETEYWHHAFVFGLVEASGPYQLHQICPEGWSEFYSEMTSFQAILRVVTLGLYAPAEVHVVCAAPPGMDVNSISEGPLPELEVGTRGRGAGPGTASTRTRAGDADAGAAPSDAGAAQDAPR
jgi:hypothetical protein